MCEVIARLYSATVAFKSCTVTLEFYIYITFIFFNLIRYYSQVFKDKFIHFCFAAQVVVLVRRWWLFVRAKHECRCQLGRRSFYPDLRAPSDTVLRFCIICCVCNISIGCDQVTAICIIIIKYL